MTFEKIDIQEVFHDVVETKLHLTKIKPVQRDWLTGVVEDLENCGGDPSSCTRNDLFHVEQELTLPKNEALSKRWNKAIAINKKIRMQLITSKALRVLENYENLSATSSAADISYARAVLFMCNTDKEKEVERKADTREEDQYDDMEKDLKDDNA